MVPLTPPSVLFHVNVTCSLVGETEPVPVPIVVQALNATAAHSSTGAAVNRLEVLMIQFLLLETGSTIMGSGDSGAISHPVPTRFGRNGCAIVSISPGRAVALPIAQVLRTSRSFRCPSRPDRRRAPDRRTAWSG